MKRYAVSLSANVYCKLIRKGRAFANITELTGYLIQTCQ